MVHLVIWVWGISCALDTSHQGGLDGTTQMDPSKGARRNKAKRWDEKSEAFLIHGQEPIKKPRSVEKDWKGSLSNKGGWEMKGEWMREGEGNRATRTLSLHQGRTEGNADRSDLRPLRVKEKKGRAWVRRPNTPYGSEEGKRRVPVSRGGRQESE